MQGDLPPRVEPLRPTHPRRQRSTDEDLLTAGFHRHHLLPPDSVQRLRTWFDDLEIDVDQPFFASSVHASRTIAQTVDQHIRAEVGPFLRKELPGHVAVLGAFIAKGSHGVAVEFHQDWTYTDERHERAVLCWVPLLDVDESNGALRVVPGSHRWSDALRPSGQEPPFARVQAELAELCTVVPLRAGEAILYDPALVHGSPPNGTTRMRPSVAVLLAPEPAHLVNFWIDPSGDLRGKSIDATYFTAQDYASPPSGGADLEPWSVALTQRDAADLVRRHRTPERRHDDGAVADRSPA